MFHMLGGRLPNIHVFSKYVEKASNLRLVEKSMFENADVARRTR